MHFDWTALGTWATFFATIAVGAFVYGRLTEKVNVHDRRFMEVGGRLDGHSRTIQKHGEDIAGIKAHLNLDRDAR
ncbi:MAG: hypothetical protein ACLGPM_07595 [Acidobacteriota bacterium]